MSNYQYHVDIVFCIDCTETMNNVLSIVKSNALRFYSDLQAAMAKYNKPIDKLRVRIVAFRDYLSYAEETKRSNTANYPMLETDFFTLPEEANKFEASVRSLYAMGGGDQEEDALEALAHAIRSDWDFDKANLHRHVIVLWTDAAPHELGFGKNAPVYPKGMAKDFSELTAWWGFHSAPGAMKLQDAKRLLLFAPKTEAWENLAKIWNQTILYPSEAGKGLSEVSYQSILSVLAGSINN